MKWEMVRLGDVCSIVGGGTPDRSIPEYWNGNIPWVTVKDFVSKRIKKTQEHISEIGVKKSATNIIKKGSIIVPTRMALGKASICDVDLAINQDIKALVIKDDTLIDVNYLCYFYESQANVIESQGKGATVKGITLDVLKDLQIPLPPLAIQKRIAEVLDAADALRRKDQQLLQKYDELAQAVFVDMFGDPVRNEKGWEVKRLGEVGTWRSGGTPLRSNLEFYRGDIPWLSSGELNGVFISESIEHINKNAIENSATSLIEKDSLLLGMYDTAALKSSINKVQLCCNQAIAFSKLDDKTCNTLYVYYYIQLNKDELKREQRGVRQKNMNLSMIKDLKILFPPKRDQDRFAEIFEKILVQKELVHSKGLFQTLLHQAFNAELITP